jgi:hypothetical protein
MMRIMSKLSFATTAIAGLLLAGCASTGKPVVEQTIELSHPGYLSELPQRGGEPSRYLRFDSVKVRTSGELRLDSGKLWFLFGRTTPVAWDDLYQVTGENSKHRYYAMTRTEKDARKTLMQGYDDMSLYLCTNGRNPAEAKDQCARVVSATLTIVFPHSKEMPNYVKHNWEFSSISGFMGYFLHESWEGSTAAEYQAAHDAVIAEVQSSKRAAAAAETRSREEYAEGERRARAFFKGAKVGTQISCSSIGWMARMEMPSDRTVFNCQQAGNVPYRDLQSNGWVVTNMMQQPGFDVRGDPISNYAISIRKVR